MEASWLDVAIFGTALGCGVVAGVFFAFSTFVMKALARLPAAQGIAAMNAINAVAVTPLFMTALFGTAAGCLAVGVSVLFRWQEPAAAYLLVAAGLYLVGTILVTMVFNVPRNNALAAVNPASGDGARLWSSYLSTWTAWNHVRTASALVASALLIIGFCLSHGA